MTDLALATSIIDGKYKKGRFYTIYPNATENIDGYMSNLDFKNKKVLTVCASGDHILNIINNNGKDITSFDINPLSIYYYRLKEAAIKTLSYEEYLDFFNYNDTNPKTLLFEEPSLSDCFKFDLFEKIKKELDSVTREFWEKLYAKTNKKIGTSKLFSHDTNSKSVVIKFNNYLKPDNYELIKQNIYNSNVTFINCDIKKLPNKLNEKYDYIFTSNISQYLDSVYDNNHLENYRKLISQIEHFLTPDGKIYFAYLYDYIYHFKFYDSSLPHLYDREKLDKYFNYNRVEVDRDDKYSSNVEIDAALILKK